MTLKDAYQYGEACLVRAGIEEARLDAWYLLEHVSKISRAMYYAMPEQVLKEELEEHYKTLLEARAERIPLQHLTGVQEFMGLPFQVNEHVLIPRQDTETAVEEGLKVIRQYAQSGGQKGITKARKPMQILDMCTGSGCILLSLLHYGENSVRLSGTGVDVSLQALKTAQKNAQALHIEAKFIQSNLFEQVEGTYQLMISNPPYIRTDVIESLQEEVKLHDPWIALDGKEDGLYFYRKIISEAGAYLEKGASLIFEIGCDQGRAVQLLMEEAGFIDVKIKKDLAGLDRVVLGVYDR